MLLNTLSNTHFLIGLNHCGVYTLKIEPQQSGGTYNDFIQ